MMELRIIRLVNLRVTKFYMDQTVVNWRMFIDTCLIILNFFLSIFVLLSTSTFLKEKKSHMFSKDPTKHKRGVVGVLDQSMYRGTKVLKSRNLLMT